MGPVSGAVRDDGGHAVSACMDRVGVLQREYKDRWQFEAVDSLEKALTGADFVVLSILPGTFDEMDSDVHCLLYTSRCV